MQKQKLAFLGAVLAVSVTAQAGGNYHPPHPTPNPTSQNQGQGQLQGQQQGQAQGQVQGQSQGQVLENANKNTNVATSGAIAGSLSGSKSNSNATSSASTGPSVSSGTGIGMGGAGGQATGGNSSSQSVTGPSTSSATGIGGNSTSTSTSGDSTSSATGGHATGGTSASSSTSGDSTSNAQGEGGAGGAVNYADNSEELIFSPVQVPSLPATIATAGLHLEKVGVCGRRLKVKPFERQAFVPEFFGLWNKSVPVQTMHGTIEGYDETPVVIDTIDLPTPFSKKVVTVYGHQVYLAVGTDGQGGGSSGALNYVSERAAGAGAALSANGSHGVVGAVVVDCIIERMQASTAVVSEAPKSDAAGAAALQVRKTPVLATTGKWRLVKESSTPKTCNGKPIPEGYKCTFQRDTVPVVTDAEVRAGAAASAGKQ